METSLEIPCQFTSSAHGRKNVPRHRDLFESWKMRDSLISLQNSEDMLMPEISKISTAVLSVYTVEVWWLEVEETLPFSVELGVVRGAGLRDGSGVVQSLPGCCYRDLLNRIPTAGYGIDINYRLDDSLFNLR